MENNKKNGKKVALLVGGGMLVAALAVAIVIFTFYNSYDPSKYGRSNGGIDAENTGIPQEAEEQRQKVGTDSSE